MAKNTSIYLNPPIRAAIDGAESVSGRLGSICDRYAEITRRAKIEGIFSADELNAFQDCCKGSIFSPAKYFSGAVMIIFDDALGGGLAGKWGIDATAAINKLAALTYVEQVALIEYIESNSRKNEAKT